MPYWQLFYHIIWATKYREPVLTADVETIIHEFIRIKAIGLGATIHAINGYCDHIHIIASIPPTVSLSRFIGQIKGIATAKFNKSDHPGKPVFWQDEYSVFSFDRKRLPYYIQYVNQQKEHHRLGTEIKILEKTNGNGVKIIKEPVAGYHYDFLSWSNEFENGE